VIAVLAMVSSVACTRVKESHDPGSTIAMSSLTEIAKVAPSPRRPEVAGASNLSKPVSNADAAEETSEIGADCNTNLK
jgi:hypothetical protein